MDKIEKEYPEFCREVQGLDSNHLMDRVVSLQQALQESEEHKEENEALNSARQLVSELSGPYRDVKKAVKAKTKYLLHLLETK